MVVDEEELEKLYWKEEMSQRDIADHFDCSKGTVQHYMNKYEIPRRTNDYDITESFLREKYIKERHSQNEIAEEVGCTHKTIGNYLNLYGINKRSHSECLKIAYEKGRNFVPNYSGENNPFYNKEHSGESKEKMRKSAIERLEKRYGQTQPNYNPEACEVIEEYGDENGYNFQHAENGGEFYIEELGYWVDGYDEDENLVIEVDESHHYKNGELREEDKRRERKIINFLGCDIVRLKI